VTIALSDSIQNFDKLSRQIIVK